MRRPLAAAAALAALAAFAPSGAAHIIPPRRAVTVEADADGVALLVAWTSERGPQGSELLARATWGRRGPRARSAIRALAAAEALEGLEILADGRPVKPTETHVKVRVETREPARLVAVVLITVPRRGAHHLTLRDTSQMQSRLMWTDRSRGRASGPGKPGRWLAGRRHLTLTWNPR